MITLGCVFLAFNFTTPNITLKAKKAGLQSALNGGFGDFFSFQNSKRQFKITIVSRLMNQALILAPNQHELDNRTKE